jgi:vacuolar-type H+-ATPase subunit H
MAENILQHILKAEQQADALLSEAQAEANEAIKGAQTAVREEERKAAVEHRALFRQIVESKRQEVQARLDAQADARRDEIEAFIRNASSRLSQASDMIVQEVLADGDR